MQSRKLIESWIRYHNKNYIKYCFESKEPRWHTKQFFLYSYKFFNRLNADNRWTEYLSNYSDIFKRDPANDYYWHRDPCNQDPEKARLNSLEWANIFELNALVGFPYNDSAKEKMLTNAEKFLKYAARSPKDHLHDFMICSAIEFMPDYFGFLGNQFFDWANDYTSKNKVTPHQIVAYLNALKGFEGYEHLKDSLINELISWIISPEESSPRRQILIWARLATRLEWNSRISDREIQLLLKNNFLKCLEEIPYPPQSDWHNIPLILEAMYKFS